MLALLVLSLGVLGYVYAGYPLALWLVVRFRGSRPIRRAGVTPRCSLVISAYNEAGVIRKKIENALSLTYPRDLLDIVVVSDASDDGTDEIVREFADRGVILARQEERKGKTAGLNAVVPLLRGEIVVFSDANAMYRDDALLMLARNFADPAIGCVTGEAQYVAGDGAIADRGERAYWGYEIQIKRLETAVGSMVGGDGAIYAIRRSLWKELPGNAINDFLNPLQIVAAGWRGVYEPDAICYEETAGAARSEYRRRVRIVSRSWRAVFQAGGVLNPFRTGIFAWCLLSHKVLRWLSGIAAVTALATLAPVVRDIFGANPAAATGVLGAMVLAVVITVPGRRALALSGYFAVINTASLVGVVKGTLGDVSGVWSTPRGSVSGAAGPARPLVPVGPLFLGAGALILMAAMTVFLSTDTRTTATVIFWASAGILMYVYAGYPALLALWRLCAPRPVRTAAAPRAFTPSVCLFIAANNEESVIEGKLHNALALQYPADRLEIVVASDGSTDRTNAIVKGFGPRVRLVELTPRRGKIAAINQGIRSVISEIVIFSDANTFLEPTAVTALVANFADARVGAVSGDVALVGERAALGRSEDLYYRYERWVQRCESEIGSMIGADGALYAIRRHLFEAPQSDTILDDMAIPMAVVRSGHRVVLEASARAHEQGSETAKEEFARKSRVIAGAVQFLTRRDSSVPAADVQVMFSLVSHKAVRWLSPAFATCAFLSSLVLAGSSSGYGIAASAQGALLVLGVAGCLPALRRVGIVAAAHYFCLVQVAAFIGLVRGVTGRQSVLWRRFERVRPAEPIEVHQ